LVINEKLQAIGVLACALIALRWLQKERKLEISVFGTSVKWSILMGI